MWLGNSRCDDVSESRVYAVKGASATDPVNTTNNRLTSEIPICNEAPNNREHVLVEQEMFSKTKLNKQNISDKLALEEDVRSELHENETPIFDEDFNKEDGNSLCNEELNQDCVNTRVTIPIKPAAGDENECLQFGTTETEYNSDDLGLHDSTKNEHIPGDFFDEQEIRKAFTSMPKTSLCGFRLDDNNLESLQDTCVDGENNASYVDTCHQKCHEFENDFDRFRPICSSPINIIANINDPPDSISSYSSEDTSSLNFSFKSEGSDSSLTVKFPEEQTAVFIQTGKQNELVLTGFDSIKTNTNSEDWEDTKDPPDNYCDGLHQESSQYEQNYERHDRVISPLSVLQIGNTNSVQEYCGLGKPFCERVDDTASDEVDGSVKDSATKATLLQICHIAKNNGPVLVNEEHAVKQRVKVIKLDRRTDLVYEVNSGCKMFCVQLGDINMLTIPMFSIDPMFRHIHTQETSDVQAIAKLFSPTSDCLRSYVCDKKHRVKEENET